MLSKTTFFKKMGTISEQVRGISVKASCNEREHVFNKRIMKIGIGLLNGRNCGVYLRQGAPTRVCRAVVVGLVGLSMSASAQILSNLPGGFGGAHTAGTQFNSHAFTTGSNSGGYTLDSAVVAITSVTGSPGDFVVGIHAASGDDPGALLENLAGADPGAAGNHTFTSGGITLDANTTYHIQLSSPTSGMGNSYSLSTTSGGTATSTDGWTMAADGRQSFNSGGSWSSLSLGGELIYAINATPVPEPHEYALFVGLGLIGFVAARRHLVCKALA